MNRKRIPLGGGFKAATYNIHSCLGTDRRFSPARVAEVICGLQADVVGLQEVGWALRGRPGFDQFAYLERETGYRVYRGLTKDHSRAQFGNAILTRYPVLNVEMLDLTVPYRVARGAILADLDVRGTVVRVINVHLGLDPWERHVQVTRILAAVESWGSEPILLLGDFNEWRIKIPALRSLRPYFPFCFAPPSFHTRRPMLRYDRIYASAHFRLGTAAGSRLAVARRASDHLPVCCKVGWQAEKSVAAKWDLAVV